jgi:hypothetical protein
MEGWRKEGPRPVFQRCLEEWGMGEVVGSLGI